MAEGQNEGQERTEEATPKRQEEAKEKGQVGRSRDLNTMALLLVAATGFFVFGTYMINNMSWLMINYFSLHRSQFYDSPQMPLLFAHLQLFGMFPELKWDIDTGNQYRCCTQQHE